MGLAQAGTIIRSGDPLMVKGMKPQGIAAKGSVIYRAPAEGVQWELIARVRTVNPTATTQAIDTTGVSLLMATTTGYSGTAVVTDNYGNIWTRAIRSFFFNNLVDFLYCINPIVGPGHTFQISGVSYYILFVEAFGASGPIALGDAVSGSTPAGGGTLQLNPFTPSTGGNVIVSAISNNANITSIDGGLDILENVAVSGANMGSALAWRMQETAETIQPTWTFVASTGAAAALLYFKPT